MQAYFSYVAYIKIPHAITVFAFPTLSVLKPILK